MKNINGKWIQREHFDSEEDRKKAMKDWSKRYHATFSSDNDFCNWLKLNAFHSRKPITPKYLKEYEKQQALIEEFYKYEGVYDGLPESHEYYGNEGKYWKIFSEEQERIYAKAREETRRRYSRVTVGHTPNTPKRKKGKKLRREFCD